MFDPTTTGWVITWYILGYFIVGLATGAVVSNLVYEDGGKVNDSYVMGALATFFWPLAWVAAVGAAIWFLVLARLLTPRQYAAKKRAERSKRKAEGKPLSAQYSD